MKIDVQVGLKIPLRQSTCMMKIQARYQRTNCRPASVSMVAGVANSLLSTESQAHYVPDCWYRSAIGSLIWQVDHTETVLAYCVERSSCYYRLEKVGNLDTLYTLPTNFKVSRLLPTLSFSWSLSAGLFQLISCSSFYFGFSTFDSACTTSI